MDIMELGAIGELVGGVAVIASLIFVGLQVRQNTISVRGANSQSVADASLRFATLLGSDPQVALTLNRGLAGDSLDPGEQAQFTYLYHAWARQTEQCYFLFRNGTLDEELWVGLTETSKSFLGRPGGARMWPSIRPRVRAAFGNYVDQVILPASNASHAQNLLDPISAPPAKTEGA